MLGSRLTLKGAHMEISIIVLTSIVIALLIQKHCKRNLENLATKQIHFSEEQQAAFDDYQKNVMRFYCTDGTKLTVFKGKLIGKTRLETVKAS